MKLSILLGFFIIAGLIAVADDFDSRININELQHRVTILEENQSLLIKAETDDNRAIKNLIIAMKAMTK